MNRKNTMVVERWSLCTVRLYIIKTAGCLSQNGDMRGFMYIQ